MIPGFVANTGMKALGKTMGLMAMKGVAGDPTMRYIMSAIKGVPGGVFGKAKSAISSNASDAPNVPPSSKTPYRNRQQNRVPTAALNGGGGGGSMGGDPSQQMVGELQNIRGMLQGIDSNISSLNQGIDDLNNGLQNVADGNYNNANKSDSIISALEELQNIIGQNGANANKSAKDALESMVETRNHIQSVASGIVRPINKNLVNMAGILERIAAANESMLKIQRYAYGLNDGAEIKASAIKKASKRVDPSDSKSMDKEAYNKEVLETQKRNIELQMNEDEDSLLYKLYKVTKDTSKSLVKTLTKDTIGLSKDIVAGTAKGAWKHFIRPFAEDKIAQFKTKLKANKEEKQKEMMNVYTQMIRNGDHESAKKLKTKLEKKGISETVLDLIAGKGISADQAKVYLDRMKNKTKAVAFDHETKDAIVKGIPLLLSDILKALSGVEKVWNHEMDTLTSKEDYIKSKSAAAKQNLLDVQEESGKNWFLRNKGILKKSNKIDEAMTKVKTSELEAMNTMGKINMYDGANEKIEEKYEKEGIKSQKDKLKYLKNISGTHFFENLSEWIMKGTEGLDDLINEKYEDHDAKGLLKRISGGSLENMKYLLEDSGLNKDQVLEALQQMSGERESEAQFIKGGKSELVTEGDNIIVSAIKGNKEVLLKILAVLGGNIDISEIGDKDNKEEKVSNIFSNKVKEAKEKQQEKEEKDNHSNIKIIAKYMKSLEEETKRHNKWQRTKDFFRNLIGGIGSIFGKVFDFFKSPMTILGGILTSYLWNPMKKFFGDKLGWLGNFVTKPFSSLMDYLSIIIPFKKKPPKPDLEKKPKDLDTGKTKENGKSKVELEKSNPNSTAKSVTKGVSSDLNATASLAKQTGSASNMTKTLPKGIVPDIKNMSNSSSKVFKSLDAVKSPLKSLSTIMKVGKGVAGFTKAIPVAGQLIASLIATVEGVMDAFNDEEIIARTGKKNISFLDRVEQFGGGFAASLINTFGDVLNLLGMIPGLGFLKDVGDFITVEPNTILETVQKTLNLLTFNGWNTDKEMFKNGKTGMVKGFWESSLNWVTGNGFNTDLEIDLRKKDIRDVYNFKELSDENIKNLLNSSNLNSDNRKILEQEAKNRKINIKKDEGGLLQSFGNWITGDGWNTDKEVRDNEIKERINKFSKLSGEDLYEVLEDGWRLDDIYGKDKEKRLMNMSNEEFFNLMKNGKLSERDRAYANKIWEKRAQRDTKKDLEKLKTIEKEYGYVPQFDPITGKEINKPENLSIGKITPKSDIVSSLEANSSKLNDINQQQLEALIGIRDEIAKNNKIVQNVTNNNTTNNIIAGSGNTSIRNSNNSKPVSYRDPKQGIRASSISSAAQIAAKS